MGGRESVRAPTHPRNIFWVVGGWAFLGKNTGRVGTPPRSHRPRYIFAVGGFGLWVELS